MMLGRFSNALLQAADVLAPSPPLFDDFVYYWKKLMNHYLDVKKSKPTIELTSIPNYLDHLFQIILKEEGNFEGVGPCLEYLLQHNLLDLLATLAGSDDPPGMKQHVLQFTTKLLNQSKSIILGHPSIYYAVQRLVVLCDGSTPSASESYEIQFLLSVAGILRRNHSLVPVFILTSKTEGSSSSTVETPGRRLSTGSSSEWSNSDNTSSGATPASSGGVGGPQNALFTTPLVPSARASGLALVPQAASPPPPDLAATTNPAPVLGPPPSQPDLQPQFPLAEAILSYIESPDMSVRLKACQALLLVASLPSESRSAHLIASELSLRLVCRLVFLFCTVPHTTEPTHLDDMHLSWGLDIPCNDCSTCNGCRLAAIFLSWFDFCDQVIVEGDILIGEALANRISDSFLDQVFTVPTLQKPITLTLLTKCFKMATSTYLNNVLYDWFVSPSVQKILLENWTTSDSDLAIETLRFYEMTLDKGWEHISEPLILTYLKDRSYLNMFSKKSQENVPELIEDNGSSRVQAYDVIKRWVNVLPQEVQSCSCGYEEYLSESMRQVQSLQARVRLKPAAAVEPPLPVPSEEPEQSSSSPVLELERLPRFVEGPFLKALLDALLNIPKQPYEVNLELTGIVSKLALRPEAELTEYLLYSSAWTPAGCSTSSQQKESQEKEDEETDSGGVRCLHSVLSEVGGGLARSVSGLPDYRGTLREVRALLLGNSSTTDQLRIRHKKQSWAKCNRMNHSLVSLKVLSSLKNSAKSLPPFHTSNFKLTVHEIFALLSQKITPLQPCFNCGSGSILQGDLTAMGLPILTKIYVDHICRNLAQARSEINRK